MIKNKQNTEHYFWGNKCEGFHLIKKENLSIIQEIMPPSTKEQMHFHNHAEQFFYILSGTATFLIDDDQIEVGKGEGIHILSKIKHQIFNNQSTVLEFLVISQPSTKEDRINIQ